MSALLKAPFPYFGGKRKVAGEVWQRFGAVANYVEPFFGSGAVLLARPDEPGTETVNDADGLLANFWRALASAPDAVADFADWPVNENDLHARHAWLVGQKDSLQARLEGDPEFYDARVAGWWVWGMAGWIGSGFCSGNGPWQVREVDGHRKLVHVGDEGQGVNRKRVHVGNEGQGVNRKREGQGVEHKRPMIAGPAGGSDPLGVNCKRPILGGWSDKGVNSREDLRDYFAQLAARFRRVRVCCGDWSRVCGPSVTHKHGLTAVFLDPPYADTAQRARNLYRKDCGQVAHAVREWAIAEGCNPLMRIALCGYEREHEMPSDWNCFAWNAGEGFGGQAQERSGNGTQERIWFSPHCRGEPEPELF